MFMAMLSKVLQLNELYIFARDQHFSKAEDNRRRMATRTGVMQ